MILSYVQIGGVVRDIDADTLRWICDKLDSIEGEYKEICATFLKDSSVRSRLDGVGYLSQQQASSCAWSVRSPVRAMCRTIAAF